MCNTNPGTMVLPYGLKVPNPPSYFPFGNNVSQMTLDLHRAQQIYDYSTRLHYGFRGYPNSLGIAAYHPHTADPYMHPYLFKDPRARYIHEEPKPNHSYIGLIAMAILGSRDKKLVLSDIYQWILDNYAYFRTRGPGWRNSIRHNLSLNDCFIKAGRSANGKGHYWAVHPANLEDFQKGDFRRRRAQRRVRKHMGLSVPDDDDSPSPSPTSTSINWEENDTEIVDADFKENLNDRSLIAESPNSENSNDHVVVPVHQPIKSRKRLFDMESLLAPDIKVSKDEENASSEHIINVSESDEGSHEVDVVSPDFQENSQAETSKENSTDKMSEKENLLSDTENNNENVKTSFNTEQKCVVVDQVGELWKHGYKGFNIIASRPSAFQNAGGYSWTSLSPYLASYPLVKVKGQYPLVVPRSAIQMDLTSHKWQVPVSETTTNESMVKDEYNSDEK